MLGRSQEVSQSEGSAQPASPSRASSFQTGQSSMQGGTQSSIDGSPLKRMKVTCLQDFFLEDGHKRQFRSLKVLCSSAESVIEPLLL